MLELSLFLWAILHSAGSFSNITICVDIFDRILVTIRIDHYNQDHSYDRQSYDKNNSIFGHFAALFLLKLLLKNIKSTKVDAIAPLSRERKETKRKQNQQTNHPKQSIQRKTKTKTPNYPWIRSGGQFEQRPLRHPSQGSARRLFDRPLVDVVDDVRKKRFFFSRRPLSWLSEREIFVVDVSILCLFVCLFFSFLGSFRVRYRFQYLSMSKSFGSH